MLTFSDESLDSYCARYPAEFGRELKAAAVRTPGGGWQVPPEVLDGLRQRYSRQRARPIGLGDRVAAVAQPIARAIDAVLGTHVAECAGCKRRREALNRAFPGR